MFIRDNDLVLRFEMAKLRANSMLTSHRRSNHGSGVLHWPLAMPVPFWIQLMAHFVTMPSPLCYALFTGHADDMGFVAPYDNLLQFFSNVLVLGFLLLDFPNC